MGALKMVKLALWLSTSIGTVESAVLRKLTTRSVRLCCIRCLDISHCIGVTYDASSKRCDIRDSLDTVPMWILNIGDTRSSDVWHQFVKVIVGCPSGWIVSYGNQMCYKTVELPKTWHQAQVSCEAMGASMVEITDAVASDIVMQQAGDWVQIWMGGEKRNGAFVWMSGDSRWHVNMAAVDPASDDCLTATYRQNPSSSAPTGSTYDCTGYWWSICQKRLL